MICNLMKIALGGLLLVSYFISAFSERIKRIKDAFLPAFDVKFILSQPLDFLFFANFHFYFQFVG